MTRQNKKIGRSRKIWNAGWPNRKPGVRSRINRAIERAFRQTARRDIQEGLDEVEDALYEQDDYECPCCAWYEEQDAAERLWMALDDLEYFGMRPAWAQQA